jgi:hypothetical protein
MLMGSDYAAYVLAVPREILSICLLITLLYEEPCGDLAVFCF